MSDIIQETLDRLKKGYRSGKTRSVEWRKGQLRALKRGITDMKDAMEIALEKDLGNSRFVTEFSSLYPCHNEIDHNLSHIDEYVKDEVRDTPLMLAPAKTMVRYEPLGVALIFGSWNYPYVVNLNPLA